MNVLKFAKRAALTVSKTSGMSGAVRQSAWRRDRLTILCYHGVSQDDEHRWKPSLYMTPAALTDRMSLLQRGGYAVLPLGEALQRLRERTLPPGAVALTFDDGMHDFAVNAAPILERFGFPATVYMATFYLGFDGPIFDVFCSYMIWRSRGARIDLSELIPGAGVHDLAGPIGRELAFRAVVSYADQMAMSLLDKHHLATGLGALLGVDVADLNKRQLLRVMPPDEARAMAARGFDFQLHTHQHRVPRDEQQFMDEIETNRAELLAISGRTPTHFCYPSGVYHAEFFPWLERAGVVSATTCDTGIADPTTPLLLLPRIVDGAQLSGLEFEAWLSGAAAFLPTRETAQQREAALA